MKVYGNYYKNTQGGKKQEPFTLELNTNTGILGELRELATPILRAKDSEFRGIRELQIAKSQDTIIEITADATDDICPHISEEQYIRQKAKSLKIRNWHNKKIDTLIKEIEENAS